MTSPDPRDLLTWYDRHRRDLPWRAPPGEVGDPNAIWRSEIMLQQTTVQTVGPYYRAFLERWPTVKDLAAAGLDDVLAMWSGLGYYARARRLYQCAQIVAQDHGGQFPASEVELLRLPGIGPYTAAAIAAIAFGRRAVVIDGNVERVIARLYAVTKALPPAKKIICRLADALTPDERAGDFAQAMMDLGATVCTPRNPACAICPWRDACRGRLDGIAADLPRFVPKKARPQRHGLAFWVQRDDGAVLLRRRPEDGLLGGMLEVPSTPWRDDTSWTLEDALPHAPMAADWRLIDGVVRHGFTHFALDFRVAAATVGSGAGDWYRPDTDKNLALPTMTAKIIRHARGKVQR
jgi:A/G-specific adenine glycosylase